MILETLHVDADAFAAATGWHARPEGLCKGDVCVPAPSAVRADGLLDVSVLSERLRMPLVHDEGAGVWALGPESGGTALTSVELPELSLLDASGEPFDFSSLLGRRLIITAWASW